MNPKLSAMTTEFKHKDQLSLKGKHNISLGVVVFGLVIHFIAFVVYPLLFTGDSYTSMEFFGILIILLVNIFPNVLFVGVATGFNSRIIVLITAGILCAVELVMVIRMFIMIKQPVFSLTGFGLKYLFPSSIGAIVAGLLFGGLIYFLMHHQHHYHIRKNGLDKLLNES